MITKQTTIRDTIQVEGRGLHTGSMVTLSFHPAEADTGYIGPRLDDRDPL